MARWEKVLVERSRQKAGQFYEECYDDQIAERVSKICKDRQSDKYQRFGTEP